MQTVKSVHPRQPGNSPDRKDYTQYYGFKYLHRNDFIIKNLDTGKLLKVDVYDNLMYHSENYLYSLITRQLVHTKSSNFKKGRIKDVSSKVKRLSWILRNKKTGR